MSSNKTPAYKRLSFFRQGQRGYEPAVMNVERVETHRLINSYRHSYRRICIVERELQRRGVNIADIQLKVEAKINESKSGTENNCGEGEG